VQERANKVEGSTLRRLRLITLVTALGLGLPPVANGQSLNPTGADFGTAGSSNLVQWSTANSEEQLRQLKQSLLSIAMQHKARVAASGWTTSSGAMREDVLVFSDLELEKLRPVVRSSRYGRERTELTYRGDTAQSMCADQRVRPQRLGLTISQSPNTSTENRNLGRDAATLVVDRLRHAVDQGALSNVASLVRSAPQDSGHVSTYRHFMTAGPLLHEDLQLRVAIAVMQDTSVLRRLSPVAAVRAPKRLSVELSLVSKGNVMASWGEFFTLESSAQSKRDQLAWLVLPEPSKTALTGWLAETVKSIKSAIDCHGETAIAFSAAADQATLQGGRDIGVYSGQRLAIFPTSNRMRDRGLQSSLSVVGLAEVMQVGPNSATVNVYAGPRVGDFAGMMAVPIAVLSP